MTEPMSTKPIALDERKMTQQIEKTDPIGELIAAVSKKHSEMFPGLPPLDISFASQEISAAISQAQEQGAARAIMDLEYDKGF